MGFSCHVDIKASLDKVVVLFENPDNLKEWQDGLLSFEHLTGIPARLDLRKIRDDRDHYPQ